MRYYRFMSRDEFLKVMNGKNMINTTDFGKKGRNTNSIGFCFLREETLTNRKEETFYSNPYELLEVMGGIIDEGILVGFEETSLSNLSEGWGGYAEGTKIIEYSTPNYNYNTLIPVSYNIDTYFDYETNIAQINTKKIKRNFPLDYPDKRMICIFNSLDMKWIIENEEYFDTDCYRFLATYQKLDENFILDHLEKFDKNALIELIKNQEMSPFLIEKIYETNIDEVILNLIKYKKIREDILLDNLNLIEDSIEGKQILFANYLEHNIASDTLLDYIIRKEQSENPIRLIRYPKSLANQINSVEDLNKIINIYKDIYENNYEKEYICNIYQEIFKEKKLTLKEIVNSKTFNREFLLKEPFVNSLDILSNKDLIESNYFKNSLESLNLNLETLRELPLSKEDIFSLMLNNNLSTKDLFKYMSEKNFELEFFHMEKLMKRNDIFDKNILVNIDDYSPEIKNLLIGIHNLNRNDYLKNSPTLIKFIKYDIEGKEDIFKDFSRKEIFSAENIKTYDYSDFKYIIDNFEISDKEYELINKNITDNYLSIHIQKEIFTNGRFSNEMYNKYGIELLNYYINKKIEPNKEKIGQIIYNMPKDKIEETWNKIQELNTNQKEDFIYFFQKYVTKNNAYLDDNLFIDILTRNETSCSSLDNIFKEESSEILNRFNESNIFKLNDEKFDILFKYIPISDEFLKQNIEKFSENQLKFLSENENFSINKLLIMKDYFKELNNLQIDNIIKTQKKDKDVIREICELELSSNQISNIFVKQNLTEDQSRILINKLFDRKEKGGISQITFNSVISRCFKYQKLSSGFIEKIIEKSPESIKLLINMNKLPFDIFEKNINKIKNSNINDFNKALTNFLENNEYKMKLKEIFYENFTQLNDLTTKEFLRNEIFSNNEIIKNFKIFSQNLETFEKYNIPYEVINKNFEITNLDRNIKFILLDKAENYPNEFILNMVKNEDSNFYRDYIQRFREEMNQCYNNQTNLSKETENKLSYLLKIPNVYEDFKYKVSFETLSDEFIENNKEILKNLGKIEDVINRKYECNNITEGNLKFIKENKEYFKITILKRVLDKFNESKNLEKYKKEIIEIIESKIEQDYSKHEIYFQTEEIGKEQQEIKNEVNKKIDLKEHILE